MLCKHRMQRTVEREEYRCADRGNRGDQSLPRRHTRLTCCLLVAYGSRLKQVSTRCGGNYIGPARTWARSLEMAPKLIHLVLGCLWCVAQRLFPVKPVHESSYAASMVVGKCILIAAFHRAPGLPPSAVRGSDRSHQTKFRSMVLTVSCSKKSSSPCMSLSDSLMMKALGVEVSS